MGLVVAVQMDPLDSIDFALDSTVALCLEAQRRGHTILYYTPDQLSCIDGAVVARVCEVHFGCDVDQTHEVGSKQCVALEDVDVVLLRQDPPFDMTYLTTTYLLERIHPKTLVVNDPTSVRNHPEKLFPFDFPDFIPPTLVSSDKQAIAEFYAEHKEIVIKPLYEYGGRGVIHIGPEEPQFGAKIEALFTDRLEPIMVQRFLPEVVSQDCRVILADGEIAGVVGRVPAEGEFRANACLGGSIVKTELTSRQREICETLAPVLKKDGLIFVGLDLIGGWLTEINVTCPTTIVQMNAVNDSAVDAVLWDAIEARL